MTRVVALAPDHLSCYTLTIEAGTPLARRVEEGRVRPLDESIAGDLFSATADFLEANGYRQYEISNYARVCNKDRSDLRSRHNRKYWNFIDYLGFGPAAHSLSGATRRWNCPTLDEYMAALQRGASPEAGREELTRTSRSWKRFIWACGRPGALIRNSFPHASNPIFMTVLENRWINWPGGAAGEKRNAGPVDPFGDAVSGECGAANAGLGG